MSVFLRNALRQTAPIDRGPIPYAQLSVWVQGLGFRDIGFRIQGLGFRVKGLGLSNSGAIPGGDLPMERGFIRGIDGLYMLFKAYIIYVRLM